MMKKILACIILIVFIVYLYTMMILVNGLLATIGWALVGLVVTTAIRWLREK